jgi:hypothetical protein
MIDDGEHNEDNETIIVLQVKLDQNNMIRRDSEVFGYTQERDEETNSYQKYTFILDVESSEAVMGKMNYGGWDNETDNRLNIHEKEIKTNELFTWFESLESKSEQVIYRINHLTST